MDTCYFFKLKISSRMEGYGFGYKTRHLVYKLQNGIQQGRILNIYCFLMAINNITTCISAPLTRTDYMRMIWMSHTRKTAQQILEMTLNNLEIRCQHTEFKFSTSKTYCVDFHYKKGLQPIIQLKLYDNILKFQQRATFFRWCHFWLHATLGGSHHVSS